MKYGKRTKTET